MGAHPADEMYALVGVGAYTESTESTGTVHTLRDYIGGALQQHGGRAAPTTWPVRPGQALDVYFDGKDGGYNAGYYRGTIDTATAPSATGIQKLDVDFPDDRTAARLDLKQSQLYQPGAAPAQPGAADGEVAVAVRQQDLPDVEATATPYGLTAAQVREIKGLYYDGFHYAGRDRMWELLRAKAKADGAAARFGIRYRQLSSYLAAMEHRQVHKRTTKVKTTRSFVLPVAPVRRMMMDTMNLGEWGGGRTKTQRFVIGAIDPSSKWAHAEVFQGTAPTQQQSAQVLVNALKQLRSGVLKHDQGNVDNVFASTGELLHTLVVACDLGTEFGAGGDTFRDLLRQRLIAENLITSTEKLIQRFNLASTPTQAAHIERLWSTLRTKLKLASSAEFGGIARKAAVDARKETYSKADERAGLGTYGQSKGTEGWTTWVRRGIEAINAEQAAGTNIAPDAYLRTFVSEGKAAVQTKTANGADAKLDEKGEQQLRRQEELTVGTMVRRKDLAKSKAELKGKLKMVPNWSEEVFRVVKVTKQKSKGLGNASFLYQIARTNGDAVTGSYRREELQIVPSMETEWNPGPAKGRAVADRLRAEGTISKWDEQHNRSVRDGSTWAEREVERLPVASYGKLRREQVLRRLEQYMKQGMKKANALTRLKQSLRATSGPANAGPLAILGKDD